MGQVYIPLQDMTSYGTEGWYPVGLASVCLFVWLSVLSGQSLACAACLSVFCLPACSLARSPLRWLFRW